MNVRYLVILMLVIFSLAACGSQGSPDNGGDESGQPPTISSFTANPDTIAPGETSTLSWSVTGATRLSISPDVGAVSGSNVTVQPAQTTQYTLTATNTDGQDTATTTVTGTDGGGPEAPTLHNTIAYVRADTWDEIRLINPDGTNDRLLWTHGQPDPEEVHELYTLAWRPDATELAFASTHENACSLFHSDIFVIGSDGSGYRRVTQAPACAELADYPQGTVRIPVENGSLFGESVSVFLYFQGAPGVKLVSLPPGGSDVVVFENVADFGDGENGLQVATAISGVSREILFSTAIDVQAGSTVTTATVDIYESGVFWEMLSPTWSVDGSRLGYVLNADSPWQIDPNPTPLDFGESLMAEGAELTFYVWQLFWGPTSETANQLLYIGETLDGIKGIYLVTEGSSTAGERLVTYGEQYGDEIFYLAWLPDGSGFIYSAIDVDDIFEPITNANIYEYNFTTEEVTQLTTFTDSFVGGLSVSPDGQQIVFARAPSLNDLGSELVDPDLWLMNRDGSGLRLLVENAGVPAWSR